MDWQDKARQYLLGKKGLWGDQHVIRPVRVPTDDMPDVMPTLINAAVTLQLTACGPKPWSGPINVAVSVLRGYFCREFHTGPYLGYEGRHAYLIFMPDDDVRWVVGGLDFHLGPPGKPHLCWVWLHPHFRGKGVMTDVIRQVHAGMGDFTTEKPIAPAMLRVLASIGHPDKDWKP